MEAYTHLQREATSQTLNHMNRLFEKQFGGVKAVAALIEWLKMDTIGAKGLDIPGLRSTEVDKFHLKMAAACGGVVRDGTKCNGMLLPERHMDVQGEVYLRQGVNLPKHRETGDVDDAPLCLDRRKVRVCIEVEMHKKTVNGKPLRVLMLFAGGGGSSEGWKHVNGAETVCAVELNADAAFVYGANHEHPFLQLNIADWV